MLSPEVARLVPPEPEAFAEAVGDLIDRPDERARLSAAATALAAAKYSRESYLLRTAQAYARLLAPASPGWAGR